MTVKITQSLDLRQAQTLVMTPQLQQAIKLLQMSNLELDAYLEEQLEHNPLLEKVEPERETSLEEAAPPGADDDRSMEQDFADGWEAPDSERLGTASTDLPDFDPGSAMATATKGGRMSFDDADNPLEATLPQTKSLRDHLTEQAHQDLDDPTDRRIAGLLIDLLDEAGYLRVDPAELAARVGCPPERLKTVLARLRTFDPPGIFARDLSDCLRLQLDDRGELDGPMDLLLAHLDLLAQHDLKKLAKLCGVNDTYLQDMLSALRTLNPKPAAPFEHLVVQTAVPDVLMRTIPKNQGGGWRVELNTETLPRVLINNRYYQDVLSQAKSESDKTYLSTRMNDASWLVRALDQRAQTILKVSSEIVERQNAFFLFGIEFLQPMTLKDIAAAVEMHESTISRVTTGKYIGTPRGIFELKFFFTTAIAGADGTSHSAESVKARVKNLIDAETPDAVLSDEALVDLLKKEGIELARRTVAKYRDLLHIPSSAERRKIKKNKTL